MARMDIRPMSAGEVLDRSFQVLRHHFLVLFLTALVGTMPMLLLYLSAGVPYGSFMAAESGIGAGYVALFLVLMLAVMVVYGVSWGGLVWQVDRTVAGEHTSVGAGLMEGLRSLLRLIGTGIVLYLLLFVLFVVMGVSLAFLTFLPGVDTFGPTIVFAGILLFGLLISGMIAWTPLVFLAGPVVVLERARPIAAVRRARSLAKGARLHVFFIALMAGVMVTLPYFAVPLLLGLGTSMWDPEAAGTISTSQLLVYQIASLLVGAVTSPFLAAATVFAYYDRRARREGIDVDLVVGTRDVAV